MLRNKFILGLVLLFGANAAFAQSHFEEWNYEKKAAKDRKVIEHRYTGEASVKYAKRIHRIIDAREKQNLVMHWPRNPFYRIIHEAALKGPDQEGGVRAYTSDSLDRGNYYTEDQVKVRGGSEFVTQVQNPDNPDDEWDLIDTVIPIPFEPEAIKKYRIMEDWIFDYKYSDFRARIIAIAPMFNMTSSGVDLGEQPLFWVKMEDLRPILVNQEVFNPYNDAARLSFDDWFEMRMFSSYIIKESNYNDWDLKDYPELEDDGLELLLRSEELKNNLFIFEHDLWEY